MLRNLTFFVFSLFMLVFIAASGLNNSSSLTITIKSLRSNEGQVLVAVYDSEKNYMKEEKAFLKKVASIKNKQAIFTLSDIPYGKYAVVCVHDENNNLKLDKNLMGIPKEGYGFSNDAKGSLGPPSFEKSNFVLQKSQHQISINMTYW